ncbi:hypothetical protein AMATHDRAFT_3988 [Amanita thiersii Skay4041]|uniref:RING-type E3 ubiquitin transferase n=1 Tax=Amanita thiersii Skay4041 TaxID=703135 RepID=A0A2A9NRY0_9AGAR|nr:hypothetical protein AMATHDRAFT_3988 [Amanita thiersii Skay4041]
MSFNRNRNHINSNKAVCQEFSTTGRCTLGGRCHSLHLLRILNPEAPRPAGPSSHPFQVERPRERAGKALLSKLKDKQSLKASGDGDHEETSAVMVVGGAKPPQPHRRPGKTRQTQPREAEPNAEEQAELQALLKDLEGACKTVQEQLDAKQEATAAKQALLKDFEEACLAREKKLDAEQEDAAAKRAKMEAKREARRVKTEAEKEAIKEARRVKAEEEKEARRIKAEAEKEARRVKAEAEREARRIQAEAARRAKAEADREARRAKVEAEREARRAQVEAERKAKQAEIAQKEANISIQSTVLKESTLVTCGAGIDIRRLACGFDCCYITIKNLPQNVKHHEISELFVQQGVYPELFHVLNTRGVNGKVEARIIIDAELGSVIAAGLNGSEFKDQNLKLDVSESAAPNKMGSSSRTPNLVKISWYLPSRAMIASFPSTTDAQNAVKKFNKAPFHNRKLIVQLDQGRLKNVSISETTSVKISGGLPLDITAEDVRIHTSATQIREIKSGAYTAEQVHSALRQRIEGIGDVKTYEVTPLKNGSNIEEVQVQFNSWESAKKARDLLQVQKLSTGYPNMKVWLQEPILYTITIPLVQYNAQKPLWDSFAERDDNKAAFVRVTNISDDRVAIRVFGEDKKVVGQLKVRVESVIAGERLDGTLWNRHFTTASGRQFLEDVHTQTKAYVRCDWKAQSLKMYADENAKKEALKLIKDEILRLEALEWSVRIARRSVGFFMKRGLAELKEEFGEDAVTLDLASTPCNLSIRGGEEARRMVNRMIEESQVGFLSDMKRETQDLCPICFDEVSAPVLLGCGHIYCTACIRHYLTSAHERRQFPLVCAGNEDKCRTPIAIPTIRRFLSPRHFDQLVEVAVTTYIETQPEKFRYCTTPDCPQVYCFKGQKKSLTCPSCFVTVCTECHKEAHEGMTCAERALMNDPEEQERRNKEWAQSAGARRCPSCQVWVQKIEGCNHITCHCGAHFCWVCLAHYGGGSEVYDHLRVVHGGVFDHELNDEHRNLVQNDFDLAQRLQQEEDRANADGL